MGQRQSNYMVGTPNMATFKIANLAAADDFDNQSN